MIEESGFFALYLFYGLVFFTIGSAITSRDLRFSDLKVARILWILALFAYSHGLNEWLELFMQMNNEHLQGEYYPYWILGKLLLLGLSFGFLLWFGFKLLLLDRLARPAWRRLISAGVFLAGASFVFGHLHESPFRYDLYLRNFIALPAAAMAGFGFIRYSDTVAALSRRGARNLKHAGFAILLYGGFAGAFPSGMKIFGMPVEICRAFAAFLMLHSIMQALQIFDVERKAKIEESLKRFAKSEKMFSLGKLSAGIAHEINNPLTNVSISVELLEKDLKPLAQFESKLQPRIDAIKRNIDRASKIAGELLFFSHNRETELMPVNLNEVIQHTFELIGSRRNHYDLQLELKELPDIEGIPWKIEEVLLNLLMNAMEATAQGKRILVRTGVEDKMVCCEVRDEGSGISENDLKFIFDPFFTTKAPGTGTGLGLSICFGIMEMHGGEIRITSAPGEGTTVKLLFPLPEGSRS
jgi:signal transduction histidine kinase